MPKQTKISFHKRACPVGGRVKKIIKKTLMASGMNPSLPNLISLSFFSLICGLNLIENDKKVLTDLMRVCGYTTLLELIFKRIFESIKIFRLFGTNSFLSQEFLIKSR